MTQFPYDRYAKDYLKELLSLLGKVETEQEVPGETRQIDVWFAPSPQPTVSPDVLGVLGRFAASPCLIEPFRMAVKPRQIRSCMGKLIDVCAKIENEAGRNKSRIDDSQLPFLWILSPTASTALLDGFKATPDEAKWLQGIYFFGKHQRTAIVAIHQLPEIPSTLWLRLLGKDKIQERAIKEFRDLPATHPLKTNVLLVLSNLQATLQAKKKLQESERTLIMELSPLLIQWREESLQQGLQQGVLRERRITIESFLKARFGSIDEQLSSIVEPLLQLAPDEFSVLLLELSRAELLARFGK